MHLVAKYSMLCLFGGTMLKINAFVAYGLISLAISFAVVWGASTVNAQDGFYERPRWQNDERLDWCKRWGAKPHECGKSVADEFCRSRRFTAARDFRAENAGGHTRMMSGQTCSDKGCLGFAVIACTGPVAGTNIGGQKQASFANPAWKGGRLDWCMQYRNVFGQAPRATSCGAPVADEFCRSKGFKGHLYVRADANQPGGGPTQTIQGGSCRGSHCRGVQLITCKGD